MRKIVVDKQTMRTLDDKTCALNGISSYELMEIAGQKIYDQIMNRNEFNIYIDKFVVVVGPGNNGGDGLVVAKHLLHNGYKVKIFLVGKIEKRSMENKEASKHLEEIELIANSKGIDNLINELSNAALVIDGIFGLGISKDVRGIFYDVIQAINKNAKHVISIDLPSGINSENGMVSNIAINASETIIIEHNKKGNVLGDSLDYQGKRSVLSIGIVSSDEVRSFLLNKELLPKIERRRHNSNKYHYGSVLAIGGSKGMTGAPILSSLSALKTGSGLASVAIEERHLAYVSNPYVELMVNTYKDIEGLKDLLHKKSAIVFGPGLGRGNDLSQKILDYLLSSTIPLIIDADGLYYLKHSKVGRKNTNIIITPHHGELATLLDVTVDELVANPLAFLSQAKEEYGAQVILKGACTIITDDYNTYYSVLGNPGMATAGSGDVLAGIIASFAGRGYSLDESCLLGVYVHSIAGKYAKEEFGEESLVATDIISNICNAMREID